jgi:hypothetical protein
MSSPALYWNVRTISLSKSDILNAAKSVMQKKGMTDIRISEVDTAGRTPTVHAFVAPLKKKDPPSPGPGLGTTAPPTYIVVFTAAGADAKAVLDGLLAGWDALAFL